MDHEGLIIHSGGRQGWLAAGGELIYLTRRDQSVTVAHQPCVLKKERKNEEEKAGCNSVRELLLELGNMEVRTYHFIMRVRVRDI